MKAVSFSSFVHQEFIARGLASRDEARLTGEYFAAEDVLHELDDMLKHEEECY
jgi:hypothetical protein